MKKKRGWKEKSVLCLVPGVWTRVWTVRSEGAASHQEAHAPAAARPSLRRHMEVALRYRLEIRWNKQVRGKSVDAPNSVHFVHLSCLLTRPSRCFCHSVLKHRQFVFNGSVFVCSCLLCALTTYNWATFFFLEGGCKLLCDCSNF